MSDAAGEASPFLDRPIPSFGLSRGLERVVATERRLLANLTSLAILGAAAWAIVRIDPRSGTAPLIGCIALALAASAIVSRLRPWGLRLVVSAADRRLTIRRLAFFVIPCGAREHGLRDRALALGTFDAKGMLNADGSTPDSGIPRWVILILALVALKPLAALALVTSVDDEEPEELGVEVDQRQLGLLLREKDEDGDGRPLLRVTRDAALAPFVAAVDELLARS